MALKIYSHNVCNGFDDAARGTILMEEFKRADADAAIFPEAASGEASQNDEFLARLETFKNLGYSATHTPYDLQDGRLDEHVLLSLQRGPNTAETVSLGIGKAMHLELTDYATNTPVDFFGVHLLDRVAAHPGQDPKDVPIEAHDQQRKRQAHALLEHTDSDMPTIIAGDMNSINSGSLRAKLLRSPLARQVLGNLPISEPGQSKISKANEASTLESIRQIGRQKVGRIGSLATRLSGMAEGGALDVFDDAGFRNCNVWDKATMSNNIRLFQLDYILYRNLEDRYVNFDFKLLHTRSGASDHRAIAATINT